MRHGFVLIQWQSDTSQNSGFDFMKEHFTDCQDWLKMKSYGQLQSELEEKNKTITILAVACGCLFTVLVALACMAVTQK